MSATYAFFNSQLFGVLLGALLGYFGSFFTARWDHNDAARRERFKESQKFQAWLDGLQAELNMVERHIAEIMDVTSKAPAIPGGPCTKRLSAGFLEASRLNWCEYDQSVDFLESLGEAYADIVHTNGMLDRAEERHSDPALQAALKSLEGVRGSVSKLKNKVAKKAESGRVVGLTAIG